MILMLIVVSKHSPQERKFVYSILKWTKIPESNIRAFNSGHGICGKSIIRARFVITGAGFITLKI